jgi:hypothetical protein
MWRHVAIVVLVGGYLPWRLGFEFLDAGILVVYGCLAALFVAPRIARRLGAEQERRVLEVRREAPERGALWREVGEAAVGGWGMALLLVGVGLVVVNVTGWHGPVLLPPAAVLVSVVVWSGSVAVLASAVGARMALESRSAAEAARGLRGRILVLLLAGFLVWQLLPGEWREWFDAQMTPGRLARDVAVASVGLWVWSWGVLRKH